MGLRYGQGQAMLCYDRANAYYHWLQHSVCLGGGLCFTSAFLVIIIISLLLLSPSFKYCVCIANVSEDTFAYLVFVLT